MMDSIALSGHAIWDVWDDNNTENNESSCQTTKNTPLFPSTNK